MNWHGRPFKVRCRLPGDVCLGGDLGTRIGTQNMPPSVLRRRAETNAHQHRRDPGVFDAARNGVLCSLWTQAMTVQNFVAIDSRNVVKPVQIAASLKKIFALQVC